MSFSLIPFLLLLSCFLLLWCDRCRLLWPYFFIVTILSALWLGVIDVTALFAIAAFAAICFGLKKYPSTSTHQHYIFWGLAVVGALALALHLIPGFKPTVAYENIRFSEISAEYTIRYGLDKAIVGFLILAMLADRVTTLVDWKALLVKLPVVLLITLTAVMTLGMVAGYLQFDPKFSLFILWWALGNLFITCIAEEAFFRLLIQEKIKTWFSGFKFETRLTLLVCAVLFGFAHIGGGWLMVVGATVAGLGYAYVYHKTGRIEAAILTHFILNLSHILFFGYPYVDISRV